jgi:hypothetical protein
MLLIVRLGSKKSITKYFDDRVIIIFLSRAFIPRLNKRILLKLGQPAEVFGANRADALRVYLHF